MKKAKLKKITYRTVEIIYKYNKNSQFINDKRQIYYKILLYFENNFIYFIIFKNKTK